MGDFRKDRKELIKGIYGILGEPSDEKKYGEDVVLFYEKNKKIFRLLKIDGKCILQLTSIFLFNGGEQEYMRAKSMSCYYDGEFKPMEWKKRPGILSLAFTKLAFLYRYFKKPYIKPDTILSENLNFNKF
ncbi:MAG: hypothetical protein ACE5K0_11090 [Candidatus Methanofastidiosia archaeon]